MPKVSVVIPTRNRPQLVLRAVHSALSQTMDDLEIIVVIDGQDPASEASLASIQDSRVRVIALPQSVGGCEARNTGARSAAAPWIALLDDDDEWMPRKLELQLEAIQKAGTSRALSVTRFLLRPDEGQETVWPLRFPLAGEPISEYLFCTSRNVFQTSTVMVSREVFLEQPFTKDLRRLQDWDWMLRILQETDAKLVTVDEVLTVYYVHERSISNAADWKGSLEWANRNRHLLSASAYACFISKKCVGDARRQGAKINVFLNLLSESLRFGANSRRSFSMFLAYSLLSPKQRQTFGDRFLH